MTQQFEVSEIEKWFLVEVGHRSEGEIIGLSVNIGQGHNQATCDGEGSHSYILPGLNINSTKAEKLWTRARAIR